MIKFRGERPIVGILKCVLNELFKFRKVLIQMYGVTSKNSQ